MMKIMMHSWDITINLILLVFSINVRLGDLMEIKDQIWTAHAEQKVRVQTPIKLDSIDKVISAYKSQTILYDNS